MVSAQLLAPLVPALPLAGAVLIAALRRRLSGHTAGLLATALIGGSFLCSVLLFLGFDPAGGAQVAHLFDWIRVADMRIGLAFQVDALSLTMMLIVTGVGTLIHLYSIGYMHDDPRQSTFFALLNLFTFAMLLLVMGANYVVTFIGWEGVGLCSYLLIGFWYTNPAYNYAARKAFVMNRIGDVGFVLGLALVFQVFGTLDYTAVMERADGFATGAPAITAITLLLFVGAIGKSAQLPLFTWLPDAMAGPTPVSALIHAATMVTAGIFLLVRSSALFVLAPLTQDVVLVTGLVTALCAATIGVFQNDIKKVLAYSTVSQLGYMFVALGLGAFSAGLFHVTTHAFFKALLFLGAGSVIHALGGEQDIRRMGGLRSSTPSTYRTFLVGTLAIAGIFPLSGFFSKDAILAHAYQYSPWIYALLVAGAVLTTYYMFRLLFLVFFGSYRGKAHPHESPAVMTAPLWVLAVLSVVGGALNLPHVFGGHEPMKHFLATAASGVGLEQLHLSALLEWSLMGFSTAVVLLTIWIAYGRFAKKATLDPEADALPVPQRWAARKWYLDELYERLFEKPYGWLSTNLSALLEQRVMQPLMVGVGTTTERLGDLLRRAQTGNMSTYLFAMVAGLLIFLFLTLNGL